MKLQQIAEDAFGAAPAEPSIDLEELRDDLLRLADEDVTFHTMVHENIKDLMAAFRYDAHPMGMLVSTVGALSTFYPDAKNITDHLAVLRPNCWLMVGHCGGLRQSQRSLPTDLSLTPCQARRSG